MTNTEYHPVRFWGNVAMVALGGVLLATGLSEPKLAGLGAIGGFMIGITAFFNWPIMDMPLDPNHRE